MKHTVTTIRFESFHPLRLHFQVWKNAVAQCNPSRTSLEGQQERGQRREYDLETTVSGFRVVRANEDIRLGLEAIWRLLSSNGLGTHIVRCDWRIECR